ncbi:MAG: beta strand repeat-containing protein [Flavobacteriaceae bacterium]
MKKGLLSLLALALTVVGCQNYDDQFAELTSQITDLQSTVDGLTGVSSSLTTLQSTVAGIQSAIAALPTTDSVADLSGLATQLDTISSTLAALQASLADVVTAEDLATISNTLGDVEADVHELLTGSSAISQDIIITTAAELEYMETVIETGENSPSGYIVTGNVTVSFDDLDADEITRANALTAKLITVIGNVDVDGAVDLATLAYIQGDYTVADADALEPLLRNLTGNLSIDGEAGAINYSDLATIGGNVTISNTASVTSLNFNGTNIGGSLNGGIITVNNAATVNIGGATITQLTANSADVITLGQEAFAATTVITATNEDATINISAEEATAALTIVGTGTTIIRADSLEEATTITVGNSAESHFGALASASGALDITAEDASDFGSLTYTNAASTIGGEVVTLTVLAGATGTLTLPDVTSASLPVFVGGALTADDATSVSLKSIGHANLSADSATEITLTEQDEDFTIAAATDFPALITLNVTGKDVTGVTTTDLAVTAATTLTTINAGGELSSLTVAGAGPETVVTSGNITDLTLTGSSIDALTLGHTFISGDTAVTIEITGTSLASIDMSNVSKVKRITVTGNGDLTSLVGPNASTLPESGATISATLSTNSLTAAYTAGTSPTAATETTPAIAAVEPVITSASVASILAWWNAAAANAAAGVATAVSIDIENVEFDATSDGVDGDINAAWAADDYANDTGYTGVINTAAERSQVTGS